MVLKTVCFVSPSFTDTIIGSIYTILSLPTIISLLLKLKVPSSFKDNSLSAIIAPP